MELLQTEDYYILNKNQDSLWFDKRSGSHECKTCWHIAAAKNPTCLGIVHALLGKIQILPDVSPRLVLVTGIKEIGNLESRCGTRSMVYCITRVIFLPLTTSPDFELNLHSCYKHHTQHPNSITQDRKNILPFGDFQQKVGLSKTFGTIRNVTSSIKTATVNVAATATGQNKNKRESRDKERFERRILDELIKMFNESESFYYCNGIDLTSSLQRQNEPSYSHTLPLWERADDRFFWNKHMLEPFQNGDKPVPDCWLIPIIQGFIQIENVPLELGTSPMPSASLVTKDPKADTSYTLILISRRSRRRAGTRYKRRGVDEKGNVANYVETEQIMKFSHHQVAFVQVRGSVPLFWSQPGYKYRPPPRLDKGAEETASAFKNHFEREIEIYKKVVCISLIEQIGKEKVISDEYLNHVMLLDSPAVTFVTFDFHEYCRGMRYENVAVLVEGIEDIINHMLYCWVDKEGVICHQNGVFRVNCIDCLDRTNVVQTALGKAVLENQFAKLGIIPPEHALPRECRLKLQLMWANNGDTISKQYAGTSALKGDFTRTGERNFAGLMKDGMNSANRYYRNHFHDNYRQAAIHILQFGEVTKESWVELSSLEILANVAGALVPINPPQYMADIALGPENELAKAAVALSRYYLNRFKDAYRQATIDTMLGLQVSEDLLNLGPDAAAAAEEEDASLAQHVKHVIDDCKKLLVPDAETILGAWGLIDADPNSGDTEQTDMDIILVLTRDSYYVAQYDEEADRIMRYERVSLIDLDKIELGPYTFQGMFKQSKTHFCIRFNYQVEGETGFLHMFRSMNIRFFNNMAVTIKTEEEVIESVKAIGDTFDVAAQMIGCEVKLRSGRLERRKSRGRTNPANPFHLLSPIASFTKTSPDSLKIVGTRAFTNMTLGLAKLNPMSSLRLKRPDSRGQPSSGNSQFYTQHPTVAVSEAAAPITKNDLYLRSCGLLICSSCNLSGHSGHSYHSCVPSPPLARAFSDSHLSATGQSPLFQHLRILTPEILVSGDALLDAAPYSSGSQPHPLRTDCLLSVDSGRVRKLSHSSDEVDTREGDVAANRIPRASSATKLDLDLGVGGTEGSRFLPGLFGGLSRSPPQAQSPLSSPLSALQRETVMAPFSVLARGVQSLAPGRIAKGVQSIGANLDPRKLKAQRQKQLEEDLELKERKFKCQSRIIQL